VLQRLNSRAWQGVKPASSTSGNTEIAQGTKRNVAGGQIQPVAVQFFIYVFY